MSRAALFTTVKRWKQSKCPSIHEWMNTTWYKPSTVLFSLKKERDPDTCYNMDELLRT